MLKVVVYTQPSCVQCDATKRTMQKHGVEFTEEPLQERPEVLELAQREGWTAAPIVLVEDGDWGAWSGFNPGNIKLVARWEAEHGRE